MSCERLVVASLFGGLAFAAAASPAGEFVLRDTATLSVARAGHQATLTSDGNVLVTGGCAGAGCSEVQRSVEVFEPERARFVRATAMKTPRVSHTASALRNGLVLVAGGWTGAGTTASTEIYDPSTGRFAPGPEMSSPRMDATATVLQTGEVLIVGGATRTNWPTSSVDRLAPTAGKMTASAATRTPRVHHAAARLRDGRVLVVGGLVGPGRATSSAEIYDPASNTFRPTASLLQPRCKHAALLLADGRVMVLAGSTDCNSGTRLASTEIFDPATEAFEPGPTLISPRYKVVNSAIRLDSGAVMIAGDADAVEVWTPGMRSFERVAGSIGAALAFSSATLLGSGKVLVIGGYDASITPTARTWEVALGNRALR